MRYVMLIYENESAFAAMSEAEKAADMAAWFAYSEELGRSGTMRAGEALQSVTTATTVRGADDGTIVADGPFAETKEQLGGYFVVDAADLDAAIAWAAMMPHLPRGGSVEVRPVMEFDTP